MKVSEVFYVLYIQQRGDRQPRRLLVFYSRDTLDAILAYELGIHITIPKEYKRLEYVHITMSQYADFRKQFDNMGILQAKNKGIPEGEKE